MTFTFNSESNENRTWALRFEKLELISFSHPNAISQQRQDGLKYFNREATSRLASKSLGLSTAVALRPIDLRLLAHSIQLVYSSPKFAYLSMYMNQ